jgi:hypothetical protein
LRDPKKFTLQPFAVEERIIRKPLKRGRLVPTQGVWQGGCTNSSITSPFSRGGFQHMKKRYVYLKQYSILLTLAGLLWIVPSANAQEVPPHTTPPAPPDITRYELASFDTFLNSHPEIAEQLRKDPRLADNQQFVQDHPAFQQFLQDHPEVRQQLAEEPRVFMRDAARFDHKDENPKAGQMGVFDAFLDSHPEMAEQLRKDPSLADNREYLQNHPDLQAFLRDHPEIHQQLAQDPRVFMSQDDRFNRQELSTFDNFLDSHPEIAEQLRKNPTLGDNREFLQTHPALQQFLQQHPGIREQFSQDPRIFMKDEERYARNNGGNNNNNDQDWRRGNMGSFHAFLGEHPEIAQQLSKDPSLAKNDEYLENHPELREYLKTNAGVKEQLAANPQDFMNSMKQFDNSDATKKQMMEPKPKQ